MEIPVWTIVLGLIGLLVNLIIGLIAWTINSKLADLSRTIDKLIATDNALSADLHALTKDLSEHKLYAANTYARASDISAIFAKLDALRADLIAVFKEAINDVNARINYHHPAPGKD